MIWANKKHSKC